MPFAITGLGTNSNSSGSTLVLTTGVDCPKGSLLVIVACEGGTATAVGSLSLSAGGSPGSPLGTTDNGGLSASGWSGIWGLYTAADLPSGGTITYTKQGATADGTSISAFFIQGGDGNAAAVNATPTNGTTGSPSISATVAPNQVVIGAATNAIGADTWTQASGWTSPNTPLNSSITVPGIIVAYILGQTGSKTYNPTLGSSLNWAAFELGFNALPIGAANFFSSIIRKPRVIAGGAVVISAFPPSTTPQGFSTFFDRGPSPATAANQPFAAFEARGPITSTTPEGGWAHFYDSGPKPGTAALQSFAAFEPLGTISPPFDEFSDFFDANPYFTQYYPSTNQYLAGLQQWSAYTPRGQVTSTTPQGFAKFFDNGPAPPTSALQRWSDSFEARGSIIAATPEGFPAFFDWAKAPQFPVPEQQWGTFQPRGGVTIATPQGFSNFFDFGPVAPSAARQPFSAWQTWGPTNVENWGFGTAFGSIVKRARVISGGATGVVSNTPSITPQGGWPYFFDNGPAPPTAARQQWAAFEPFGVLGVPLPNRLSWQIFFDSAKVTLKVLGEPTLPPPLGTLSFCATGFDENDVSWIPLLNPAKHPFTSVPPPQVPAVLPPTPATLVSTFFDQGKPPTTAALQQWAAFQSRGAITSITPQGWAKFFDNGPPPSTAARQQWTAFFPQVISSTGPQGWARFFDAGPPPPTAALQRWDAYPIRLVAALTPQGWGKFFDQGPAPATAARQQWSSFEPQGLIFIQTPEGWAKFFDGGPPPPTAALQQFAAYPARLTLSVGPEGASYFFDRGPAPSTAANQPFSAFEPQGPIISVTPQGFPSFFDGRWLPPLPPSLQQWAAWQPQGKIVIATPQGWSAFFDWRWQPQVSASLQQFLAFPPEVVRSTTPQGWSKFFDSGPAPATAALQRWDMFVPRGFVQPPPPNGFYNFFDNGAAPSTAVRQPFAAFEPQGKIASVFPSGWTAFYDIGPKPPTAALQQWAAFSPSGAITSFTPQGWARYFDNGPAPSTAANQPFAAFPPAGFIITGSFQWGFDFFFDSAWTPPYPAHLQRSDWTPLAAPGQFYNLSIQVGDFAPFVAVVGTEAGP